MSRGSFQQRGRLNAPRRDTQKHAWVKTGIDRRKHRANAMIFRLKSSYMVRAAGIEPAQALFVINRLYSQNGNKTTKSIPKVSRFSASSQRNPL